MLCDAECESVSHGNLRGAAGGDGISVCVVRQAPVMCVMAPPIHLGALSMALVLWLPIELHYYLVDVCVCVCARTRAFM